MVKSEPKAHWHPPHGEHDCVLPGVQSVTVEHEAPPVRPPMMLQTSVVSTGG